MKNRPKRNCCNCKKFNQCKKTKDRMYHLPNRDTKCKEHSFNTNY